MASVSLFHTAPTDAEFRPLFESWDEGCRSHPDKFPDVFGPGDRAREIREAHARLEDAMWMHVRSVEDLHRRGERIRYNDHRDRVKTFERRLWEDESDGVLFNAELNSIRVKDVNLRQGSTDVVAIDWGQVDVRVARTETHVRFMITSAHQWAVSEAKRRIGLRVQQPFGIQRNTGQLRPFYMRSREIRAIRSVDTRDPTRTRGEKYRKGDGMNDIGIRGFDVHTSQVHNSVMPDRMHVSGWESQWWDEKVEVNGLTGSVSVPKGSPAKLEAYVAEVILPGIRRERGNLIPIGNPF